MVTEDEKTEAMKKLAVMMLEAGCEGVVMLRSSGEGVLMVADEIPPSEMSILLRKYADSIDGLNSGDEIGRVVVEVEDDPPA